MVVHWTKQCFWSVLDWPDIVTYICICILYGIDYQTYFCVALLRHLQDDIIYQHSSRNLLAFLKVKDRKRIFSFVSIEILFLVLSNSKFLNEKYTRLYGLIGEEISFDSDVRIKRTSLFQC